MTNQKSKLNNSISRDSRGFTVVEVIIAAVILGMITIVSFAFWQYFTESYDFSFGKSISISDAYRVTSTIVRELREAQYGEEGSHPLALTNDQELAFFNDVDKDGDAERVRYWLESGVLKKGVIEPSGDPLEYDVGTETEKIVVEGVVNGARPVFYYYNSDWPSDTVNNPLSSGRMLGTRMIRVELSLQSTEDRTASASTLTSSVVLRRLDSHE